MTDEGTKARERYLRNMLAVQVGAKLIRHRITWTITSSTRYSTSQLLELRHGRRTVEVYVPIDHHGPALLACGLRRAAPAPTQRERDELMEPPRKALEALRKGACSSSQLLDLGICCQVAHCIERKGVVRGLNEQIQEAYEALCDIDGRARSNPHGWVPPICHGHELARVDTLVNTVYEFQLRTLSAREFRDAVELAKAHQRAHAKEGCTA